MATYNKKIPQLPELQNPSDTGYTIYDDTVNTYSVRVGDLTGTKHWLSNETKVLEPNKTVVISDDYVLENSNLILNTSNTQYSSGILNFKKEAQIFIGGNSLLVNSNIINNGKISVAGGLIMSGTTSITGTGIII